VDLELVALLRARCELVERLWERKRTEGLALDDPSQERRVLGRAAHAAAGQGLDPVEVERIFQGVIALGKEWARPRVVLADRGEGIGSPSGRLVAKLVRSRPRGGPPVLPTEPIVKCT
jgi:chorismate mutase